MSLVPFDPITTQSVESAHEIVGRVQDAWRLRADGVGRDKSDHAIPFQDSAYQTSPPLRKIRPTIAQVEEAHDIPVTRQSASGASTGLGMFP